jgi:hypothetical protein
MDRIIDADGGFIRYPDLRSAVANKRISLEMTDPEVQLFRNLRRMTFTQLEHFDPMYPVAGNNAALAGMSASCRGSFSLKTTDTPTCRATCWAPTQTMSATSSRVSSSDAVSMSCWHEDYMTCLHMWQKTINSTTILCNNQIIMVM